MLTLFLGPKSVTGVIVFCMLRLSLAQLYWGQENVTELTRIGLCFPQAFSGWIHEYAIDVAKIALGHSRTFSSSIAPGCENVTGVAWIALIGNAFLRLHSTTKMRQGSYGLWGLRFVIGFAIVRVCCFVVFTYCGVGEDFYNGMEREPTRNHRKLFTQNRLRLISECTFLICWRCV